MIYIANSKTQANMYKMSIMEREVLFFYDTHQKVSQVGPFTSSMVELICVVAAHFYIEQCIDMLNAFKVNLKGHGATFFSGITDLFN